MKTCQQCGVEKTLDAFPFEKAYVRPTCRACERIRKRESKARQAEALKAGRIERYICTYCKMVMRNAAREGREPCCRACGRDGRNGLTAKCVDCGTACNRNRQAQPSRCRACADAARAIFRARPKEPVRLTDNDFADKRARQAAYDREVRKRRASGLRLEHPERFMEFAPDEFWKMDSKCSGAPGRYCKRGPNGGPKWVVGNGMCYECATGQPRTIFRAEERARQDRVVLALSDGA